MFRPKRDAFYLLQLCFIENVTRFCCYNSVLPKTWRVFAVSSLFHRKRDAFLLLQDFSSKTWRVIAVTTLFHQKHGVFYLLQDFSAKTWRVLLPQKYFSKKIVGMSGNGLQKKAI